MKKYLSLTLAGILAAGILSGCATTELQTQAKMTRSIFLDPVKKEQRVVYVSIHNTSGQDIHLKPKIVSMLEQKGYKITDDPDKAKYILMVNVLFANNLKEANAARGASAAGTVGAAAGGYNGGGKGALIGGLAAAAVGGLLAKATEDDVYRMVVDVLVKERKHQKVITTQNSSVGQVAISNHKMAGFMNEFSGPVRSTEGRGSIQDNIAQSTTQQYADNFVEKRTRIFAEAVKMNLKLADALPILENKIAKSIAGIF